MHAIKRFNRLFPPAQSPAADRYEAELPGCAYEPFPYEQLGEFPAFELMRLARDWVEGFDEAGNGLWCAGRPDRMYEEAALGRWERPPVPVESLRMRAAHAVVGYLCRFPDHARLRDGALLGMACDHFWPRPWPSPADPLEEEVGDRSVPGRSRIAPWWRAAAMLRSRSVEFAAAGMHSLWLRRQELDLPALTAEQSLGSYIGTNAVPPLSMRAVLNQVYGSDATAWPPFERSVLGELALRSTLEDATDAEPEPDWEQLSGLSYLELLGY